MMGWHASMDSTRHTALQYQVKSIALAHQAMDVRNRMMDVGKRLLDENK